MKIRFAEESDAKALLAIYNQYIDTAVTFEYDLPSEKEFQDRIREVLKGYHYLVCEEDGKILGYAYGHRHKERAAYQWNAELSIYLDENITSRGIGRKLYTALIKLLELQGVKTVYGVVTVPNAKSEGLHESMGFKRLGTYHNTGYKCNGWQDVAWFERAIGSYDGKPEPIIKVNEISEDRIKSILEG